MPSVVIDDNDYDDDDNDADDDLLYITTLFLDQRVYNHQLKYIVIS